MVEVTEHTVRCTCPSWVYRRTQIRGNCKHIRRVLAMGQEVTMV
jgi:SWIM zinc finger